MATKPFPAYEGSQPYLFVSYAHDDADAVYSEMASLHGGGVNLWYDDGIHVGTVWRRALAQALASASGIVFFASARSITSSNCLQELNFALDEDKPIVVVHLDDAAMPAELRLSLGNRQALYKSAHDEQTYRARLVAALEPLLKSPLEPPAEYLRWIQEELAGISLLGLDAKEVNRAELGQVYVTAITPTPSGVDRGETGPHFAQLIRRIEDGSLYLQGAPGSGKSTFCRWLALVVARGAMPELQSSTPEQFRETFPEQLRGRLPLLFALRDLYPKLDWSPDVNRWSAAEMQAALERWIDVAQPGGLSGNTFSQFVADGAALIILDGFDEVPASIAVGDGTSYPRAAILSGLRAVLPQWIAAGNRVLLTARPYGLTAEEVQLLDLDEARLLPLPDLLQELFVERWFSTVDPSHAADRANGLLAELDQRDDLSELRDSPMLLTGLCVKYLEGQRLPADIGDMYDALVSYVLHGRYGTRGIAEVETARRRLGVIALAMQCGRYVGEDALAPPDDLLMQPRAHLSSIRIERALRSHNKEERLAVDRDFSSKSVRDGLLGNSGLLRARDEDSAEFYHLSIQDFLVAERLDGLDVDVTAWLKRYTHEPRWRAVFGFWFARLMRTPGSPARALRKMAWLRECLAPDMIADRINAVLVWGDCLELAAAKQDIGDYGQEFHDTCMLMLESEDYETIVARPRCFSVLGRLELDDRDGIGIGSEGLPDISWVAAQGGSVRPDDGSPELQVEDFEVSRYPITNRQFDAFVGDADGYRNASWWDGAGQATRPRASSSALPNVPRNTVTWDEATAFTRWLGARTGGRIRLQSEEEWFLLQRRDEQKIHFGGGTAPVGVNRMDGPLAVEDLHAEGMEWTSTCCDGDGIRDVGTRRVLKGTYGDRSELRAGKRQSSVPDASYADVRFRIVRES